MRVTPLPKGQRGVGWATGVYGYRAFRLWRWAVGR